MATQQKQQQQREDFARLSDVSLRQAASPLTWLPSLSFLLHAAAAAHYVDGAQGAEADAASYSYYYYFYYK